MPTLTCEDFGLTQEQMLDRLIETMSDRLFGENVDREADDDSYQYSRRKQILDALNERIQEEITKQVNTLFEQHVLGKVDDLLANLIIPKTNKYGEPKEPPKTLIEYITERAENYLNEGVNWKGETKTRHSYDWKRDSSRLMFAVNKHLEDKLNELVSQGAKQVQSTFADQVQQAVELAVQQLAVSVKTEVKGAKR